MGQSIGRKTVHDALPNQKIDDYYLVPEESWYSPPESPKSWEGGRVAGRLRWSYLTLTRLVSRLGLTSYLIFFIIGNFQPG